MDRKMALVFSSFAIGVVSLTHLFGGLLTDQTIAALDTLACNVPADYATIQSAVNEPTCNEVFLDSGTFIETVAIDRSITIQGQGQQNTLVKPDSTNSVFAIGSGVAVTLTNMTIANGNDFTHFGGGIYVDNSALTIEYITLVDNRAHHKGAGIYNLGGEILIDNSQLIGNSAGEGAGIYNLGGDIAIEYSLLKGNSGETVTGGAIYTQGGGTITIRHSILEENSASGSSHFGGAIYNDGSTLLIEFCDLLANTSDQQGGAIYNKNGMIDLSSSKLKDNHANSGGAIANFGFMNITESDLIDNEAGSNGAAILNVGTMLVEGGNISTNFADSDGGGIANWGDLTIADSIFIANNSTYEGGAIHNENWITSSVAKVKITNSQFRQNSSASGGAIMNAGGAMLEVVGATLLDNSAQFGGAIENWEDSAYGKGILNVTNSALVANSADYGGALINAGEATIENSTFYGNQGYKGGGIRNSRGRLVISGSTLAENSSSVPGGGILSQGGEIDIVNTIVSDNTRGGDCWFEGEYIYNSHGHNLDSDGSCYLTSVGDIANADPLLDVLHTYNGSVFYQPLLPGSPAIDAGDDLSCLQEDQRGAPRPFDGNGDGSAQCDIGAIEQDDTFPIANFSASPTSSQTLESIAFTNQSSGDYLTVLWDFGDGTTSTVPNPTHMYSESGCYTATLTIDGYLGSDSVARRNYVYIYSEKSQLPIVLKP